MHQVDLGGPSTILHHPRSPLALIRLRGAALLLGTACLQVARCKYYNGFEAGFSGHIMRIRWVPNAGVISKAAQRQAPS